LGKIKQINQRKPMKKTLIAISILLFTLTSANASNCEGQNNKAGASCAGKSAGAKHALKHANPMPNLMRLVIGNAEILGLSPEQLTQVKAWTTASKPKMRAMIISVMKEEAMLHENALTTDKDVVAQSQKMLDTRKKIIEMKTKCRATLKSILNEKQYANVVKIYRASK
jgi:hypothetical protein